MTLSDPFIPDAHPPRITPIAKGRLKQLRAKGYKPLAIIKIAEDEATVELASWAPVDLAAVLAGDVTPLEPTQLIRDDGLPVLYPGRLHSFHGEPESLKSLTAQVAVAQVLKAGGTALYVDHEGEARDVVGHLLALGVPAEAIVARLTYVRPHEPLTAIGEEFIVHPQPDISVIDGVDQAMAVHGLNPNSASEYRRWLDLEAHLVQKVTTGATILIDHVAKDRATRGDWAGGTGAKLAAIDAAFNFEIVQPFGRGRVGVVRIKLAKDRPGTLRGHQGAGKEIVKLRVTSHPDDSISYELLSPAAATDAAGAPVQHWQPTAYMEKISRLLENSGSLSKNAIETSIPGKATYIRLAVDALVEDGFVEVLHGDRGSRLHHSVTPYREASEGADSDLVPTSSPPRPPNRDEVPRPSSPPLLGDEDGTRSSGSLDDLTSSLVPGTRSDTSRRHIEAIRN